ncbi:MAG: hypothetical protein ACRDQA_07930 [Nocardioidaceae bacterium]
MTQQWEDVEVPRGAFVSWGSSTGQHVTGKVLAYAEHGGTNFNGDPCPQLSVELTDAAASINKAGERTDFPAGELVVLNAGQVSLQRAVRAAQLEPGDLVKIELSNLVPTARGQVKEFSIKVARGAGQSATPAPAQQTPAASEAPF